MTDKPFADEIAEFLEQAYTEGFYNGLAWAIATKDDEISASDVEDMWYLSQCYHRFWGE